MRFLVVGLIAIAEKINCNVSKLIFTNLIPLYNLTTFICEKTPSLCQISLTKKSTL